MLRMIGERARGLSRFFGRLAGVPMIALAAALAGTPLAAQEQSTQNSFTPEEARDVETIIRNYLIKNPEVLVEAISVYQARQRLAEEQRQKEAVVASLPQLSEDEGSPVLGNPEGDVLVVEFFDYRCPYCRRVADMVRRVVEEDGNIRLVMKEFPILGPESIKAAQAALYAWEQGKYQDFHFALMAKPGDMSDPHLRTVAREVGLDPAELIESLDKESYKQILARNIELGRKLGVRGTPAFVVGRTLVPGAIDEQQLKQLVATARSNGS